MSKLATPIAAVLASLLLPATAAAQQHKLTYLPIARGRLAIERTAPGATVNDCRQLSRTAVECDIIVTVNEPGEVGTDSYPAIAHLNVRRQTITTELPAYEGKHAERAG